MATAKNSDEHLSYTTNYLCSSSQLSTIKIIVKIINGILLQIIVFIIYYVFCLHAHSFILRADERILSSLTDTRLASW